MLDTVLLFDYFIFCFVLFDSVVLSRVAHTPSFITTSVGQLLVTKIQCRSEMEWSVGWNGPWDDERLWY